MISIILDELTVDTVREPDITEKSGGSPPGATPFTMPGLKSLEGTAVTAQLRPEHYDLLLRTARISFTVIGIEVQAKDGNATIEFVSQGAPMLELLEHTDNPKPKETT